MIEPGSVQCTDVPIGKLVVSVIIMLLATVWMTWKLSRYDHEPLREATARLIELTERATSAPPVPQSSSRRTRTRTFVRPPDEVLVTRTGECYHMHATCGGLPPHARATTLRSCRRCCVLQEDVTVGNGGAASEGE